MHRQNNTAPAVLSGTAPLIVLAFACSALSACSSAKSAPERKPQYTPSGEQKVAQALFEGDGQVCGTPEIRKLATKWLSGEDELAAAHPDVDRTRIAEILDANQFNWPAATIESVRPDIGLVSCRFARLSLRFQATADGEAVKVTPGNDAAALGFMLYRAGIERLLPTRRVTSDLPAEPSGGGAADQRSANSGSEESRAADRESKASLAMSRRQQWRDTCQREAQRSYEEEMANAQQLEERGYGDPQTLQAVRKVAQNDLNSACNQ